MIKAIFLNVKSRHKNEPRPVYSEKGGSMSFHYQERGHGPGRLADRGKIAALEFFGLSAVPRMSETECKFV